MEKWENKMYGFNDTTINRENPNRFLPTSAMMYDGMYLEDLVEGYQTLKVEGREMLSLEFEQQGIQIGSFITNQSLPSRTISVTYKLEDNNPEKLQFKFKDLLNFLYRTEDVEIRFRDESDYYYYGRYATADKVAGDSNSIISTFTIYCADPLKYTREVVTDGYIGNTMRFPITPTKIKVTLEKSNAIRITNGEQTISVTNAAIKPGDQLVFDFADEKLMVNDEDWTSVIDLESDFENFVLRQGQKVVCNNGKLKVFYRGATI